MHVRTLLGLVVVAAASLAPSVEASAQSLRGSRAKVERAYRQALSHELHFYESSSGVRRAAERGRFVRLSGNAHYTTDGVSYPYVLPATHTFVTRLAGQYHAACGERLVVTSATRPRSFQLINGSDKSVHPTGMAVDLRKPQRAKCLQWLRSTLADLNGSGAVLATEEFRPPHFHVAVFPEPYRRYVERRGGTVRVASAARTSSATQVAAATTASRKTYRVQRGDSLWGIARRHGTSVEELKRANEMRSSRIVAGQTLVIPAK
jgi:LysM repeat protein